MPEPRKEPRTVRQLRTSGEGSIYQRHDARYGCPAPVDGERPRHKCTGPWMGSLVVGWRDGKPVRKKVSGTSKSDVAGKLRELRERSADRVALPSGRALTVEAWLTYWLTNVVPKPRKKNQTKVPASTIRTYGVSVNGHIIPLLGHIRLDRLTPEDIELAWDFLAIEGSPSKPEGKRTPLTPNTVHHAHSVLRRALQVAIRRGKIKRNPAGRDAMDAPPKVDAEIKPIPQEDIDRILTAAEGEWNEARWSVALALGLRPAEAMGLRWSDVNLEEGYLIVAEQLQREVGKGLVGNKPKSDAGGRVIFLPPTLLAKLKAHRKAQTEARLRAGDHWTDSGRVFTYKDGRAMDTRQDGVHWHKLLDKAGVNHRRLYDARHSAATMLLLMGVPTKVVMDILGHSQISVTMKYQHTVDALRAEAARVTQAGIWGNTANG